MQGPGRRDVARPLLIVFALIGFALNSTRLEAEPLTPALLATGDVVSSGVGAGEIDLVKWAFTQGALALVLMVVLWSYRRDYARIQALGERDSAAQIATSNAQIAMLTTLVGDCKAAIERSAAQSAATEKAIHRLARALEEQLADRREADA